ncbi:MAG: hypothetical protein ACLFT2_07700 [Candidatus Brocadiia bacterium]
MHKNDYSRGQYFQPTRSADGITLQFDRLGASAESGDEANYFIRLQNDTRNSVDVRLSAVPSPDTVMTPRVEPDQFRLGPLEDADAFISIGVTPSVAPGGWEEHRFQMHVGGNSSPADEFILTTARHLPHPYLIHTEEGWEHIREKMRQYDWAKQTGRRIINRADDWTVPDIHPSGLYVFGAGVAGGRYIRDTIAAWKLTGNRTHARKVVEFLLKLSDPEKGFPATMRAVSRYAVKQGVLWQQVGQAYDLLRSGDVLSDAEDEQIRRSMRLFIRQWAATEEYLLQDMRPYLDDSRIGNHPLSVVAGGVICSLALQDLNHVKRYLWGPGGFDKQMSYGILDDGFWFETDPGYHRLVTEFLWKIARACEPWGYNLFDRRVRPSYIRHAGIRKTSGLDTTGDRMADGTIPDRIIQGPRRRNYRTLKDMFDCLIPLADYRGVVFANNKSGELQLQNVCETAHAHFQDPDFAWALGGERGGFDALVYGADEVPKSRSPRPPVARADNAGLYVLRSTLADGQDPREQLQAVLKCGSHGHGHGHYDQTNLLSIMRYGRSFYRTEAVVDWKYDVPEQGGWLKTSPNHNMILVDQGNQHYAECTLLFTFEGDMFRAAAVQAIAPWTTPDSERTEPMRHRRLMLVTDGYIMLADSVQSAPAHPESQEHTFDWMIHPVGLQSITASAKDLTGHDEQFAEAGACRFITDCDWYDYEGPLAVQFEQHFKNDPPNLDGVLKLNVHSAWPAAGRLMIGQYPDGRDGGSQKRHSMSIRTQGRDTRYLTVIEPHENEPIVRRVTASGPSELEVDLADGRRHVFQVQGLADTGSTPRVTAREYRGNDRQREEHT